MIAKQDLSFKKVDYQLEDFKKDMEGTLASTEQSLKQMVD